MQLEFSLNDMALRFRCDAGTEPAMVGKVIVEPGPEHCCRREGVYIRREQVMQQATLHALRQACQVLQAGEHQGAQYRASGPVVPAELRKQACDRLSVYKRVCVRYGRHGLFKLGLLDSCHMQPVSIEVLAKYSKEVSPGVLAPGPPQCHMCPCSVLWTGLPFSCTWLGLTCL